MLGTLHALLTGGWLVLAAPVTAPGPGSTAERATRPELPITVAIEGADGADTQTLLEEYLEGLEVEPRFRRVPAFELSEVVQPPAKRSDAVARVWVLVSGGRASIFIVDRGWERVYIRHLEVGPVLDEVVREQLATIVFMNVESLLAGGVIGIQRAEAAESLGIEAPPEEPPEERPPAPREPVRPPTSPPEVPRETDAGRLIRGGGFGVGYGVRVWSAAFAPEHGPRVDGRLVLRPQSRTAPDVVLGAELTYFVPSRAGGTEIEVLVQSLSPRAYVGVRGPLSRRVAGRVRVGVGVEATRAGPVAVSEHAVPSPPRWFGMLSVMAGLGLEVALSRRLRVGVAATLDFFPRAVRYRLDDTGEVVFSPWALRPGVAVALRWGSLSLSRP